MDPDFENTYTMYCGGGGDSDSGGNDSGVSDTGDMGSEAANEASTDAGAASVGAGDSSDTGDLGSEAANVEASLSATGQSGLGSGDTGLGGSPTDVGTSHTGDSTNVDPSDGITQYTETKSESLRAALDTYKAEQAAGLRPSNLTTTAASLVTGLPIGTLSMSLGVINAYNARRGNTTTSTTGSTASTGTTGLLNDTTSDGDSNDPIIYQTSTPLNNPADSAAIDFFANVKALDTRERYDLAKQKIAGITRPQAIDVQNSPYYNYLQKFNLNKGIL